MRTDREALQEVIEAYANLYTKLLLMPGTPVSEGGELDLKDRQDLARTCQEIVTGFMRLIRLRERRGWDAKY
jgi:hypothetical protein